MQMNSMNEEDTSKVLMDFNETCQYDMTYIKNLSGEGFRVDGIDSETSSDANE